MLLLGIMLLTAVDIIGSKLFNRPVPGFVSLTSYLQLVLIPLAAGLTQIYRQHIRVEVFTDRLPNAIKNIIDSIVFLVLGFVSILLIWLMVTHGLSLQRYGIYDSTLGFPIYPLAFIVAFALIPLCLAFVLGVLDLVRGIRKK